MGLARADLKDKQGGGYDAATSSVPKKSTHKAIEKHRQAQDGADRGWPLEDGAARGDGRGCTRDHLGRNAGGAVRNS